MGAPLNSSSNESSPMVNVITQEPLENSVNTGAIHVTETPTTVTDPVAAVAKPKPKAPPRVFATQTLALAKTAKDSEKANTVACFDPKK